MSASLRGTSLSSALLSDFGIPQGSVLGAVHFTGVRALI